MKNVWKRFLSFMMALAMVISVLPLSAIAADTVLTLLDGDITVTATGEATLSGTTVTAKASATSTTDNCGNEKWSAGTNTVTVTNNSGAEAIVKFTYSASATEFTVNGTPSADNNGTYSGTLAAGGAVTLVITTAASDGSLATLELSGFEVVANETRTLTFPKVTIGGTATAGGVELSTLTTNSHSISATFEDGIAVTATPASGYTFLAWMDTNNNILSTTANTTLHPTADATVSPIFVANNSTQGYWQAGSKLFTDLNQAASSGASTVVLLRNATLPAGTYNIPAGVTVLIPFDDAHTLYTTNPEYVSSYTTPSAYCTLTMANGAIMNVAGQLSVGAKHATVRGGKTDGSAPTEKYGHIKMNAGSQINVTGTLYAWGYISGDGVVTAESGAVVYENMQFTDFRGGSITMGMISNTVFPMSQYYVQNIETKLVLKPGATEYALTTMEASGEIASSAVKFIAPDGGMFTTGAATTVTKDYHPSTDRLEMTVDGDFAINSLQMTVSAPMVGKITIDSAKYVLPINSNIDIKLLSGKTTVNQDAALMPGSSLTIAEDAEMLISSEIQIYVYDRDDYVGKAFLHGGADLICAPYSPTAGRKVRTSADLVDAVLDINGIVTVTGELYTTSGGAQIISSGKTGAIVYTVTAGTETVTYQSNVEGDPVEVPITAAQLLNGDKTTYVPTASTAANSGFKYNASEDKWEIGDATVVFEPNGATGTAYSTEVPFAAIVNNQGNSATIPDAAALGFTNESALFTGWNSKADGTGTVYKAGETLTVTEDITLYAQWQLTEATVSYDANGGTGTMEAVTVDIAETGSATCTVAENVFSKEGYTFEAWNTKADGSGDVYAEGAEITVSGDITLYAQWAKNTYTVEFDDNAPEGTTATGSMADQVVAAGSTLNANQFVIEGYTFVGWNTKADGSGESYADGAAAPEANVTLYAQWQINTYTITWIIDGKSETTTVEHGLVPTHADPTKATEGGVKYTFAGWSPEVVAATGNATYTAVFTETAVTYNINWDTDGDGDVDKTTTAAHGTVPTAPAFSKADTAEWNYTFTGWKDSDGNEYTTLPAASGEVTYTALFTSEKQIYTITWIVDGESTTTSVAYGETPVYSGTPTKAETAEHTYTFTGWSPAVTSVTGPATYTAQFTAEANTYVLTINFNGGKDNSGRDFYPLGGQYGMTIGGSSMESFTACSREGYTLVGWNTAADGSGESIDVTKDFTMPAHDVTIYAQWEINEYTITWNVEGVETTTTVKHGETPVYDGTPAKEADAQYTYTFAGWSPEVVAATGTATYTATFTPVLRSYNITFVVDGVETKVETKYGETPVYDAEGKVPEKTADTYYSYTFAGWDKELAPVSGEATYTATWTETPVEYSVSFVIDGEVIYMVKGGYGASVDASGLPSTDKTGYTWNGWDTEIPETFPAENIVITGSYTVNQYTITFKGDFNTEKDDAFADYTITKNYGEAITAEDIAALEEALPTITGWEFLGWYYAEERVYEEAENPVWVHTSEYAIPENMGAEHVTVYAYWSAIQYDLIVKSSIEDKVIAESWANYEEIYENVDVFNYINNFYYDDSGVEMGWENLLPAGYTFAGYKYADGSEMTFPIECWPAEDVTIIAQFVPNDYTVTFMNGDQTYAEITAPYGSEITMPEDPTKEGFVFAGWVDAEGNAVNLTTMPLDGMTVYTSWTVDSFKLNFFASEGDATAVATFEVPFGTDLLTETPDDPETEEDESVPSYLAGLLAQVTDPSKTGYTWNGWNTANVPATMPAEAVNVYGTWTVNSYDVKWVIDGETYTTTSVAYGAAVTAPEAPVKEGHTFTGWTGIPATMPAEEVTVTGSWTVNTYTITFDVEGIDAITAAYGTAITWPENPTKEGHTFWGWDKDNDDVQDIVLPLEKMPAENLNLEAVWKKETFYIYWNVEGDETYKEYAYGDPIVAPENPTKAPDAQYTYKFVGWKDVDDNMVTFPVTTTQNDTYYAVFEQAEAVKYTVKFVDGENTVYETQVAWNGEVSLDGFEVPTKDHYTLSWTVDGAEVTFPYAMTTKEVTFVANWTPISYTIHFYASQDAYSKGEVLHSISAPYGTEVAEGYAFTAPEGWNFNGWKTSGSLEFSFPCTMGGEDVHLIAQTSRKVYTATFVNGDWSRTYNVGYNNPVSLSVNGTLDTPKDHDGYTFKGWFDENGVAYTDEYQMPAHNVTFTAKWSFTGWVEEANGTTYLVEDEKVYFGEWAEIDGAKYWFDSNSYIVKDITLIDGSYHAFDHASGKFLSGLTGIYTASNGDLYYVENGVAVANKGLVQVDDPAVEGGHLYYYFGCGMDNCDSETCSGEYKAQRSGSHWAEIDNGYLVKWGYTFDENGVIIHDEDTTKTGVHEDNGVQYYYIDGVKVHYGLFIGADGEYYYARSDGSLVISRDYWISESHLNGVERNGEPVAEGTYTFDAQGRIVWPVILKNGIYAEDGSLYYYVDSVRTYAGLIKINGAYYYVRGTGEVVNNRTYWVTKTNGLMDQGSYKFDEDGKMMLTNGFVDVGDKTYYYVNGNPYHAGLIEVNGSLYYVKSSGEVVKNCKYWVSHPNGLVEEGSYEFDVDGKMIVPETEEVKNGIVEENGSLYYYVDGVLTYGGLIEIDGSYYYVRGNGEVVHGRYYWITKTNDLMKQGGYTFADDGKMIVD